MIKSKEQYSTRSETFRLCLWMSSSTTYEQHFGGDSVLGESGQHLLTWAFADISLHPSCALMQFSIRNCGDSACKETSKETGIAGAVEDSDNHLVIYKDASLKMQGVRTLFG